MVDKRVADYIKKGLKRGYDVDALKKALIKEGWPAAEVNDAIKTATGRTKASQTPKHRRKKDGLVLKHSRLRITVGNDTSRAKAKKISELKPPERPVPLPKQKQKPKKGLFSRLFGRKKLTEGEKAKEKEAKKQEAERKKAEKAAKQEAEKKKEDEKKSIKSQERPVPLPKQEKPKKGFGLFGHKKGPEQKREEAEKAAKKQEAERKKAEKAAKKQEAEKKKAKKKKKHKKFKEIPIIYEKPVGKITTEVDTMLVIISQKRKIRSNKLAKIMKVDEKKISEWTEMLENWGMIKIHYPIFGKPILMVATKKVKVKKEEKSS